MALSGSLETFDLADVLRLLAFSEKTGRLVVVGPHASGRVHVVGGQVVGTEVESPTTLELNDTEAVFGLLRFESGTFTFENDDVASTPGAGSSMEELLGAAEAMLAEWRSIEPVVPSLEVWITLRPEMEGSDVTIDAQQWRCIALVGTGVQVGLVAETLRLNELESCRLVKELVDAGLLQTIDMPVAAVPVAEQHVVAAEPKEDEGDYAPEPIPEPASPGISGEADPSFIDDVAVEPAPVPEHEPATGSEPDPGGALSVAEDEPMGDEVAGVSDATADVRAEVEADTDAIDADDMARQLANLSPRAAEAVAAVVHATTDTEPEGGGTALKTAVKPGKRRRRRRSRKSSES